MPSLSNITANTRRSGRGSKRIRNNASITFAQALKDADRVVDENSKTKATQRKYSLYFKQAVNFVQEFARNEAAKEAAWKQHQTEISQPENDIDDWGDDGLEAKPEALASEMPPHFETAFDGPPKAFTPLALSMFLSEKCVNQGCKNGVAYAIYSSMLEHYDNLYVLLILLTASGAHTTLGMVTILIVATGFVTRRQGSAVGILHEAVASNACYTLSRRRMPKM